MVTHHKLKKQGFTRVVDANLLYLQSLYVNPSLYRPIVLHVIPILGSLLHPPSVLIANICSFSVFPF